MLREIKKKQIILENRKPYSSQIRAYIREMDLMDWVCSSMRLDGSKLNADETESILNGEFVVTATLEEHSEVEKYHNLINNAFDQVQLSNNLTQKTILAFHQILTGHSKSEYRTHNPILISLDYNPPHPLEITEQMDILMNWFYSDEFESNPVLKAAYLHHRLIEIYPFETYSEATARACMFFFLMSKGYPTFAIDLSEQEYNASLIAYLKKEDILPFYHSIEHSLYRKIEVLMQLTAASN